MAKHREYYKGEAIMASPMASPNGFPQAWAVVSLVSPSLPMVHSCTKNVSIMH
jgi:hypothetical protein